MLLSLKHTELARLHFGLEPLVQQRVKLLEPLVLLGLGARESVLRVAFHQVDLPSDKVISTVLSTGTQRPLDPT
jgi:hypothetical protein